MGGLLLPAATIAESHPAGPAGATIAEGRTRQERPTRNTSV